MYGGFSRAISWNRSGSPTNSLRTTSRIGGVLGQNLQAPVIGDEAHQLADAEMALLPAQLLLVPQAGLELQTAKVGAAPLDQVVDGGAGGNGHLFGECALHRKVALGLEEPALFVADIGDVLRDYRYTRSGVKAGTVVRCARFARRCCGFCHPGVLIQPASPSPAGDSLASGSL